MPTDFTALIECKNKNQLDANWTTYCVDLGDFLFSTLCEMENSGINFTKSKNHTTNNVAPTPLKMTLDNLDRRVKRDEQGTFPGISDIFKPKERNPKAKKGWENQRTS